MGDGMEQLLQLKPRSLKLSSGYWLTIHHTHQHQHQQPDGHITDEFTASGHSSRRHRVLSTYILAVGMPLSVGKSIVLQHEPLYFSALVLDSIV